MRRPVPSTIAVAAVVALLGVAGCGDDNDDSGSGGGSSQGNASDDGGGGAYGGGGSSKSSGGGETLQLSADPGGALKFDRSTLQAKAGKVTIDFDNPSSATAPHAVEIEGNGVEEESETIEPGNKASVTADLKPGRYTFYCPVGDHEQAGMKGTLTVR
jgi:plastocyanin